MSLEWEQVVVDARDPAALGRWWADVLGWVIVNESPEEFEIRPSAAQLPGLLFTTVPEAKQSKNRLHLDFRPDDQQAEVERFLRAGARHADIGQGDTPWVVLADPQYNEFCVLSKRLVPARSRQHLGGEEFEGALKPTADLTQVHLVEASVLIGPDGVDVRRRIRAARRRDYVFGDELGELPEVPRQREQLRRLPWDAVRGRRPAPRLAGTWAPAAPRPTRRMPGRSRAS